MITYHPDEHDAYWSFEGQDVLGRFYILEATTYEDLIDAVIDRCMATTGDYAQQLVALYEGHSH